jgi:ATP:ADP antiporter, AAA family
VAVSRWIDIRPEERRPTFAAFGSLLGITAGHTLLETARDALFLAKLPANQLPWMYLAIAGVGLVLSTVARRSGRGAGGSARVVVSLLLSAAITAGFWIAGAGNAWLLYALYVWTGTFASWVIVQFWLQLGASYTVVQARRLYGFIGTGSVLGAVLGAAGARALAEILPARHLLVAAAALLVATAVGPALFLAAPPAEAQRAHATKATKSKSDLALVTGHPYVRRILFFVLVSTVALTTVDYVFKATVAREVPADRLGAYFANVYVVLNAISFVVQLGIVGWVLRQVGITGAVWIMPVLVLGGAGGVAFTGALLAAVVLKGVDGALRHSLHRTGTELLYIPIPDSLRGRAKPLIDLLGQRGGQALASLAILALVALGAGPKALAIGVAVLTVGWMAVAAGLRRHYLDLFRQNLREGRIDYRGDLPQLDVGALEALFTALNSEKDAEVLGALELLAAQQRQRLIPALILYHPSRTVVLAGLDILTREGRNDFVPVARRLLSHADGEVRAAALRAIAAVDPTEDFLRERLADEQDEVRATALCTLVARQALAGDQAEEAIRTLLETGSPAARIAFARAVGAAPVPRLEAALLELVKAREPEVQMEAAWAMGRTKNVRFVPNLIALLEFNVQGAAARDALADIGALALAELDAALDDPEGSDAIRIRLPRAIARFEPNLGAPVLLRHLGGAHDGMLRFRILRALGQLRKDDPDLGLDEKLLQQAAGEAVTKACTALGWRVVLADGATERPELATAANKLIVTLLRDKERHAVGRLFRALGLLHPGESFDRIQRGLGHRDPKRRASSRELCENLVAPPLKAVVLTLIDELSDNERLARLPQEVRPKRLDYEALCIEMIERGGDLGRLAAYHAREAGFAIDHLAPANASADEIAARLAGAVENSA